MFDVLSSNICDGTGGLALGIQEGTEAETLN